MKARVIIIDDEEGARESLSNILTEFFPSLTIVAKADSTASAKDLILQHKPDLLFLDIEMPGGNAFDLLSSPELQNKIDFNVIFITAFDQYAIQAIKFSALDYLLKPIDVDDLREALQRHESRKAEKNFFNEKIDVLLNNFRKEKSDGNRKVAVPDMEGLTFIPLNEIVRCESDGNYTVLYCNGGKKVLSSKPLSDYDAMLSMESFFRVHRSHLVNLNHIKKYHRGEGGYIVMSDSSKIEVSRRKKNEFIDKVGNIL